MSITHITSLSQLSGFLNKNDKLSVIDFHAQWCGPCHTIAPVYESLAKQYPTVNFLKCDVDAAPDVSGKYGVRAMPTFIFLKGSQQVDMVQGANRNGLQSALQRHATAGTVSFTGKGQTLSGSSTSTSQAASMPSIPTPSMPDISNVSSPMTVFLGLLAAYFALYYVSS